LACFESIDKLTAGGLGVGLLVDGMATVKDVACAKIGHRDERAGEDVVEGKHQLSRSNWVYNEGHGDNGCTLK
jgi:hypothetical protein